MELESIVDTSPGTYKVIAHTDEASSRIGTVKMDPNGVFEIVDGSAEEDGPLHTFVEEMNQRDLMHQEAVAPEEARPFERYTRIVRRGTPDFISEMLRHLRDIYGIELVAQ